MSKPLEVLVVEDSAADAELCAQVLERAGYAVHYERVEDEPSFREALRRQKWNVVLSDYTMPRFSAPFALRLLRAIAWDLPVIVVTGTISDETAVDCLKLGAEDYVLKDNLTRLAPAVEHALAACEDRRERARLEEQLRHAQRLETIGTLAGGVAHDFSNLLTAIAGSAELLKGRIADEPVAREALATIAQAVEQATGVTRALLTFSHRVPSSKQPVDLRRLTADTCGLLARMLPASVELLVETEGATPVWVEGDRVQIQQVLLNLATNARDAMPTGGTLRVRIEADEHSPTAGKGAVARLVVEDTGAGMPPEIQERILDPFFTTKPRDKGTGLGLAIVHGIVGNHHGNMTFESQVGKGTRFVIELPGIDAPTGATPGRGDEESRGRGERILIGERRPYLAEIIASSLSSMGYSVLAVHDCTAIRSVCRQPGEPPNLLVIDHELPPHGGVACLVDLEGQGIGIPAILTTDLDDVALDDALLGRTIVLRKPYQMPELLHLIRAMLQRADAPTGNL